MTYPTLLPRTLGVDWTITIDPVDPSEPPTGWTSMTVDLRSGPTEDFDLLATSRTIAGPLSQTTVTYKHLTLPTNYPVYCPDVAVAHNTKRQTHR